MRTLLTTAAALTALAVPAFAQSTQLGSRPMFLVDRMAEGELKDRLAACEAMPMAPKLFSIGHRGAALQFPEHTAESYTAAARQGAGIIECDVTFTKDKELVCRHAQNDLHTTTNILASDLAATCVTPFAPATPASADGATEAVSAAAECRTSELTLAEFQSLRGKMDAADTSATTVEGYMDGTANWRTDLYADESATLLTHAESIELIKSLGGKFTPELKSPSVEMPFDGFSQEDYAQKMIDEYKAAGIPPADVWAQSFNLEDVLYWIENEPEFGAQAVYLDDSYDNEGWDHMDPATWEPSMPELAEMGVKYIAPPLWVLVTLENGEVVPSAYANAANEAGLGIITWTLERSGPLNTGGGWYFQSITDATTSDAMVYELVDVLAQDVGVAGIFSDWPATVTYYANCVGLD